MPVINVSIIAGRPPETRLALIEGLTKAAVDALGVPADTVRVLLWEIPGEHFAVGGVPKKPLTPG